MTSKVDLAEKMNNPEGFVQVSTKLLSEGGRYFFVKTLNGAEDFKAGAYALVNFEGKPKHGNRVLVSRGEGSMAIMRLKRSGKNWVCAPLKKSVMTPMFITADDLENVILGIVERIFDV